MRNLIILFVVAITSACTDSELQQFCERAQDCNYLSGSVEECIENLEAQRDRLPPSDRGELDLAVQDCLDHPSCNGFRSCVAGWSD